MSRFFEPPSIIQTSAGMGDTIQGSFATALRNERTQGTLIEDLDIDEASQMLLNALIGMNLFIKMRECNEAARPTARGLQKTIMSWRVPT